MSDAEPRPLILASTSPYRRLLLERLRHPFEAIAPDVDESRQRDETTDRLAIRLAQEKANAVASLRPQAVVIGADQVADLNGQPLGKPGNHARAVEQLQRMRGQTVVFQTAVAVVCIDSGFSQTSLSQVRVKFRNLTDAQIEAYVSIEPPYDCAGSAKSEGLGIALLDRIDSDDPTALIGLPLIRTCQMLESAGLRVL